MNRRLPVALTLIGLIGAVGVTAWEAWQEHLTIAALQVQLKASDQALIQAKQVAKQSHDRLAEAAKKREETRKAREAAASATITAPKKNAPVDLTPYLEKQPGYAQLRQLLMLRQVNRQYGDLKGLNLPPEQLDKLRNLLAEKLQAPQDAREAALQAGIEANSPEMRKAVQEASSGVDSEIKALVGPDQYTAVNNLQMQAGFRTNIQFQISPDMNAAGLPLSTDQINALAQAQQDAQKTAAQAMRNNGGPANYQAVMNQAMADQAAKVLTPDQLAVFQQSISINSQMAALQAKAREAAQQELGSKITSFSFRGY